MILTGKLQLKSLIWISSYVTKDIEINSWYPMLKQLFPVMQFTWGCSPLPQILIIKEKIGFPWDFEQVIT